MDTQSAKRKGDGGLRDDVLLRRFRDAGCFSELDLHFARLMSRLDGREETEVFLAAVLVSQYNRAGHVCADLAALAGRPVGTDRSREGLVCPPLDRWRELLETSSVVGRPGEFKPLILDPDHRLYLHRYWEYQNSLAVALKRRMAAVVPVAEGRLGPLLDRLFPPGETTDGVDWQKTAAAVAACKQFCIISGGPGTGKTTTIARIMALLLELDLSLSGGIVLAAPTGKAADRMRSAIRLAKADMNCPEDIRQRIPEDATTIHRLLGGIAGSPYFRHHAGKLLPVSLVIIDEASMVDLALMAKLVQALPDNARLILVGDHNQLSSVEAGSVLGDICGPVDENRISHAFAAILKDAAGCGPPVSAIEETPDSVGDCIVRLQHNYRFPREVSLGAVSAAVRIGDGRGAMEMLSFAGDGSVSHHALPDPGALEQALKATLLAEFGPFLSACNPRDSLSFLNRFRLLCALREGPYGVSSLNRLGEKILADAGLIASRVTWYAGRPVMITANDYALQLFNGDIGVALPDPDDGNRLRVFFQRADGLLRKFHPARIGPHETAFAVTVHKSQGSEFDKVLLLLPAYDAPVLTRELVYTGLTRARRHAAVWADEGIFRTAVARRVERFSGLGELFWPLPH